MSQTLTSEDKNKSKKIMRAPTRATFIGLSSASLGLLVGWSTDQALSKTSDYFFPDQKEVQAAAVRAELSQKTDEIRNLTVSMSKDLSSLREGSPDRATMEGFLAKAEQLILNTEGLRPTISRASALTSELARADAAAKAADIELLGFSSQPDIAIQEAGGFELCDESFSFGVAQLYSNNRITAFLSFQDKKEGASSMGAGQSLSIDGEQTRATVYYVGTVGNEENIKLGFNVSCAPLPS